MRRAAAQAGAVLLPVAPSRLGDPSVCASALVPTIAETTRETYCESWRSDDGLSFRFLDSQGVPHIAIATNAQAWRYARLARRGNEFFVLEPKVTTHTIGKATQCECDGMPRPVVYDRYGFVVDDLPTLSVKRLEVLITEDALEWECKEWAV